MDFTTIDWHNLLPQGNQMQQFANQLIIDSGSPYLFHEEGSPYLYLPLEKQKVLAKIRRGGTRTRKSILKRIRNATRQDYTAISLKCIEALIVAWQDSRKRLDRIHIVMKVPFNFRSLYADKRFPRVIVVAYKDWQTYVAVKVDAMLEYLYNIGKFPYTAKELRKQLWAILQEEKQMAWLYTYAADISKVEGYVGIVSAAEDGVIVPKRKEKGRGRNSKYRQRRPKDVK